MVRLEEGHLVYRALAQAPLLYPPISYTLPAAYNSGLPEHKR